eukprot:s502_g19.t1
MEVCWLVSGDALTVLDPSEFVGKPILDLKRCLAARIGASRFRLKMFLEETSEEMLDDEILQTASNKNRVLVVELRFPDEEEILEMAQACHRRDILALEKLLRRAVHIDFPCENIFHSPPCATIAAEGGDLAIMELLLEARAEIDLINERGRATRLLIDANADVNCVWEGKYTPLWFAALDRMFDLACLLVDSGASLAPVVARANKVGHQSVIHYVESISARQLCPARKMRKIE